MNERGDSPSDWYPYQPRLEGWRRPGDREDPSDPEPPTTGWPMLPEPVESSRINAESPSHTRLDNTWLPDQVSPHAGPRSADELERADPGPPHSPWATILLALVSLAGLGIAYLIGPLAAVMVGIAALISLAGANRRSTRIVSGLVCLSSVLVLVAQLFD